ncbi:MAG: hypothetical protein AAFR77_22875, partial [Cyanobacteria bacterium J06631_2]
MYHHNTYDRFLGSWWGSIFGQGLVQQPASSPEHIFAQPWLLRRRQVAEILLHQELRLEDSSFALDQQFVFRNEQQAGVPKHNSDILSLLPLIILRFKFCSLAKKIIKGNKDIIVIFCL